MNNLNNSHFILILLIITIILIQISKEIEFNPIPEGNGKLNQEYSHQNENNLFFIFLNFRHGARASLHLIDDYNDMLGGNWEGKGELTNLGRRQHYEVGLKNRKRYSFFLENEYNPKEVLIYSTEYNRSMMSVGQQLLGLYNNINYSEHGYNFSDFQNNDIEEINTIIPPINLFMINEEKDIRKNRYENIFKNLFDCEYASNQIIKNWKEPNDIMKNTVKDFIKEYYKILKKEFKDINRKKIKTVKGLDKFCDCYLSIYYDENQKHILDKFTKYGKNLTKIKEICDNYLYNIFLYIRNGGYATDNYLITISPVIKKVINWMDIRIAKNNNLNSDYDEPKLVLFSGHDSSLSEMQHFLKTGFNIDFEYTEYASTQTFELRKYGNLFYVEIYYNDRLKMNITYEEFKQRISKIVMSDEKIFSLCYTNKSKDKIIILLVFAITTLLIVLLFINRRLKLQSKELASQKIIQIV